MPEKEPLIDSRGMPVTGFLNRLKFRYSRLAATLQSYMNLLIPFPIVRWGVALFLTAILILRIVLSKKHMLVLYFLYIFLFSRLILFLSPLQDPLMEEEDIDNVSTVREMRSDPMDLEAVYKPFVRRLPEVQFWKIYCISHIVALFVTFLGFDVPVYWPLLAIYLVLLTFTTLCEEVHRWKVTGMVPFDCLRPLFGLPVKPKYRD